MEKPIIVYIEDNNSGVFSNINYDKDALAYFLRKDCGCEVIQYLYDIYFEQDIDRIKRYYIYNHLLLVLVKQEKYDSRQHEAVINLVRSFSNETPIVVIPNGWGEERFVGDESKKLYAYHHTSKELINLVRKLRSEWKPTLDWLGAETELDRSVLSRQLEDAYVSNHLDDDGMLGTPDYNHMVVAEALRLRLIPSVFIKKEFDDTIKPNTNDFNVVRDNVFNEEVLRIANMNDVEKKQFENKLLRKRGYEPCESGGVYVRDVSCGNDVNGFAIDPVTLETYITSRFGEHHMAARFLEQRIVLIEHLRNDCDYLGEDQEYQCRGRIRKGLIFSRVEGFSTPILQLHTYGVSRRVSKFIYGLKKFIPINTDGELL